eukprot:g8340.t1
MSGIASMLHGLGYAVQGSDCEENASTLRLRDQGISVHIGHHANHVRGTSVVVVSSGISQDNPEILEAIAQKIPVIKRAEMLAELMRNRRSVAVSGSHGKTSTTCLMASLFVQAGCDPSVINGGIMNAYESNIRMGQGEWVIVEGDESDGSFVHLSPTLAVVTNIDPEHMVHYGSEEVLKQTFTHFLKKVPFYGGCILCVDHPVVQDIASSLTHTRVLTYGFSEHADVRAENLSPSLQGTTFDVVFRGGERWNNLFLNLHGTHNVQNALSVVAAARYANFSQEIVRQAFSSAQGVKRRFTCTGVENGVTVIDDYAHHPVEVRAVLKTARSLCEGRLFALFEPHRYSRLADLFEDFAQCFEDADELVLLPVYSAGEQATTPGSQELLKAISPKVKQKSFQPSQKDTIHHMVTRVKPGDMVLCMGAGHMTQLAYDLPRALEVHDKKKIVDDTIKETGTDLFDRFGSRLKARVNLAPLTWFRVGGEASLVFKPQSFGDLQDFLQRIPPEMNTLTLGMGSNILMRDGGFEGTVIRLCKELSAITFETGHRIRIGAGALDRTVAQNCAQHGLSGLEFLATIPGTIGGALRMNAGCYGHEIKDTFLEAKALDPRGKEHHLTTQDMGFGYRTCSIPKDWIFTEAVFQGSPDHPDRIHARIQNMLDQRSASQPSLARTGGSTFKNPPHAKAWTLIDQAGCRGMNLGRAMVSDKHCNFLLNTGDATAQDLENLGEQVREKVLKTTGIPLTWEIERIGRTLQSPS